MEQGNGGVNPAMKTEVFAGMGSPAAQRTVVTATPPPALRGATAMLSKAIQPRIPFQDLSGDKLLRDLPRTQFNGSTVPSIAGIALVAKLGQGGMGAVYYGMNLRLNKDVAVKILNIDSNNTAAVQRFYREAQIAANINSPRLVSVFDINESEGLFYLVMEFVSGQTAGSWLEEERGAGRGGLPESEALDVCIAAAEGLSAAHSENIIHRDIKPDNILIPYARGTRTLKPCEAKLADLGLARSTDGDVALTMNDASMGTPGYMAPEQAMDARSAGKNADVFSLGATLFTLLCGEPPFTGQTPMNIILATIQKAHTPPRRLRPNLSSETERVLERCLKKDATERYTDALDLLEELKIIRAARRASRTVMLKAVEDPSPKLPQTALIPPPAPATNRATVPQQATAILPANDAPVAPSLKPVPVSVKPVAAQPPPAPPVPAARPVPVSAPIASAPIPTKAPAPPAVEGDDLESALHLAGPGGEERQKKLERIIAHIAGRSDGAMLAISHFMSEVQGALHNSQTSGNKIAALITKDVALTKTLLQTVNSAYYSNSNGVASIMHAVLLMGVDQISQLATCLAVFEAFRTRSDISDLKALTLRSVMTGASARELSTSAGVDNDLSLVGGMMHNLGRMIVAFTMPETYHQVLDKAAAEKINEEDAARSVLEFTFREIAVAVAKHWKFPPRVCAAMAGLAPNEAAQPGGRGQKIRAIISCASDLSEASAIADPELRKERLASLRAHYGAFFPLSERTTESVLTNAEKMMTDFSRTLGLSQKDISSRGEHRKSSAHNIVRPGTGDPHLLAGAMERITFGLSGPFVLNEMFTKILDAIRDGVGFEHAMLALLTPKKDMLVGRLCSGPKGPELVAAFQIPIRTSPPHPLARVITDKHEMLLTGPTLASAMPDNLLAVSKPSAVLLVPVVIDGVAIGTLYAQRTIAQGVLTETERASVRTLRDHAVTAVKKSKGG